MPSVLHSTPVLSFFLLHQHFPCSLQSSVDEMIASTAYLDLFLRSITEKSLLKTFLRFILLHRHDNDTILDTLLTRISSNSRVSPENSTVQFNFLFEKEFCCDSMASYLLLYLVRKLHCFHVELSQWLD